MPAVLQRPDPLRAEHACPIQHLPEPPGPDLGGLVAEQFAADRRDRGEGVRALVHVRTEHDHRVVPFQIA